MDNQTLVDIFNFAMLITFATINTLIFSRIVYRWFLFRRAKEKPPVLLKRDLLMFFGIGTYIGLLSILRVAGVIGLSSNLPWLILSSILLLVPFSYWAWVEWHQ
jgi:hypothetical protein